MQRVVDIENDGYYLSIYRGFLVIREGEEEKGRVPLDDILSIIVHAHRTSYSQRLLITLAERNIILVVCGSNHTPVSIFWPIEGHHLQGARMRAQWEAKKPLQKRLWRDLIVAKIHNQATVLQNFGMPSKSVRTMASKVRSGDPENMEAQAARRYWPLLFGSDFQRERYGHGPNSLLNYGYTVMRSTAARAVVAAGLHPTIGIHHRNRGNAFALVDDIFEPFRPLVDLRVKALWDEGKREVDHDTKTALVELNSLLLPTSFGASPLSLCVQRLAGSLARAFETGEPALETVQFSVGDIVF